MQLGMGSESISRDRQANDKTGGKMARWEETLSEWVACAGLGIIPLLCTLGVAYLTDDAQYHESLLRADHLYRELILFCIVTNAASVVVFASKFNLLQVVAPGGRKLPTALI